MTSKEKLNSIKYLINEFYHDMKCKGNLNDCADECWKEYQEFCEDIKQDLERLEKLEKEYKEARKSIKSWNENGGELLRENAKLKKVIEILKDRLELPLEDDFDVFNKDDVHLYRLRIKCLINEEEYDLLKEYLDD